MDPAVAALDVAKAGAILANMIESYLAGGAPPSNPEGADHDDLQDCRSTSVAPSLHLHSSVDDGAGPLQPESTERQYNLASKAQSLGWSSERIRILDRDLGQSGARATNREDFKTVDLVFAAGIQQMDLPRASRRGLHVS